MLNAPMQAAANDQRAIATCFGMMVIPLLNKPVRATSASESHKEKCGFLFLALPSGNFTRLARHEIVVRRQQPYIRPALVHFEPPVLDRVVDAGTKFEPGGVVVVLG